MVYFTAFIEFSFKLSGHPGFNGSRTLDLLAEGRRAVSSPIVRPGSPRVAEHVRQPAPALLLVSHV
jgi:hypothetical protein